MYLEPATSLLAGLITGSRQGVSEKLTESFKKTGLSHILVISGYNITLIITLVSTFFGRIHVRTQRGIAFISIGLFTLFVGADPPVIRAAIMGSLNLIALQAGKTVHTGHLLTLTACGMALFDPLIITRDISFQLSFAATLGIIYVYPRIEPYLPQQQGIRETIGVSLAAQITTLPITIWHFKYFSVIASIANLLVLPLVPPLMACGIISMIIHSVFPVISPVLSFPATILSAIVANMVLILAKTPFSAIALDGVHMATFILSLLLISVFLFRTPKLD